MDEPVVRTPVQAPLEPAELSLDAVLTSVLESAVEALVKAFLILVFGSMAIGLVSGVWRQMAPSHPPGFSGKPEVEATSSNAWAGSFREHRFLVVFSLVFALTLWGRLARARARNLPLRRASRLEKIGLRLSDGWFSLIVANAFGAMISALVVSWAQRFTVVYWVLDFLATEARNLVERIFGAGGEDGLGAWFSWYGQNRLKFAFWCFYLAAICDDLGLPNLKTLGRWFARRARKRLQRPHPAPGY